MKICVWRYLDNEKNYPGYHMSADVEGCSHLKKRINDAWSRSSILLHQPDVEVLSVPNNQGGRALRLEEIPEVVIASPNRGGLS